MNSLKKFEAWHATKRGHLVFAVLELGLVYAIGSRALDTGSWWEYGFTLIFLIDGLQNIVKIFRKNHDQSKRTRRA